MKTHCSPRRGRHRLFSADAFGSGENMWTMLSLGRARLRSGSPHQFETQLRLAGFGRIAPGSWIAPGRVDIQALLGETLHPDDLTAVTAFYGAPIPPMPLAAMIGRTWDVDGIRAAHDVFLARWNRDYLAGGDPLSLLIDLIMGWSQLLQADPGLPMHLLQEDWPAIHPIGRCLHACLSSAAHACGTRFRPTELWRSAMIAFPPLHPPPTIDAGVPILLAEA